MSVLISLSLWVSFSQLSHVEWCLRAHYGVRDSRDLGLGPLRTLVGLVQRQRELSLGGGLSHVLYEAALLPRDTR
jgi:hypothetical protein